MDPPSKTVVSSSKTCDSSNQIKQSRWTIEPKHRLTQQSNYKLMDIFLEFVASIPSSFVEKFVLKRNRTCFWNSLVQFFRVSPISQFLSFGLLRSTKPTLQNTKRNTRWNTRRINFRSIVEPHPKDVETQQRAVLERLYRSHLWPLLNPSPLPPMWRHGVPKYF